MKSDEHKALIPIQDEVLAQVLGNPSKIFGTCFQRNGGRRDEGIVG